MAEEAGFRERKKAATRAALASAAQRLTMERGLDHISADDIAAEAGVSTRTFHNYFPNKEAAVLAEFNQFAERAVDEIRERAHHQPIWNAFRDAFIALDLGRADSIETLRCKHELLHSSPSLRTQQEGYFLELMGELVGIVAEATGAERTDMYPRAVCGGAVLAMRIAYDHWLAAPERGSLEDALRESFDLIGRGLAAPPSEASGSAPRERPEV